MTKYFEMNLDAVLIVIKAKRIKLDKKHRELCKYTYAMYRAWCRDETNDELRELYDENCRLINKIGKKLQNYIDILNGECKCYINANGKYICFENKKTKKVVFCCEIFY